MAFSSNGSFTRSVPQDVVAYKVAKNAWCYRAAFAGITPAKYAKAFVPGDTLVGVFMQEFRADTTDGARSIAGTDSNPGFTEVDIATGGDFEFTLSGATIADIGKEVFATDDGTIALTGHPDAYVGKITQLMGTSLVRVRMKAPFEQPVGPGCATVVARGDQLMVPTGDAGATNGPRAADQFRAASALGLGVESATGEDGAYEIEFDATSEVASGTLTTPAAYPVDKGITFDFEFTVVSASSSAVDIDIGVGTLLTANSIADIDHADMVNLAALHYDGGSENILAQSDDNVTDVAAVDTTIDNVSGTFKRGKIVVRPSGAVEFWIAGSRVLESTTFAVASTANLCAFVNAEKSTGTATAVVQVRNLRVAGGRAFV